MSSTDGPRVLLVNELSHPDWVSVPLVGWRHARALARVARVHQLVQVRSREAYLRAGLREGVDFTAIDSEPLARPLHKLAHALSGGRGGGWTTLMAFSLPPYYYFERLVWQQFGARLRAGEFDLVHRLTPLSPALPSTLAARCARTGVPFVIGPLNGGVPWPKGFESARRAEGEWLSHLRGLHRFAPAWRSTRARAAALLVGSRTALAEVPPSDRVRCVYLPENGIEPADYAQQRTRRARAPLRIAFVGRLVPLKGVDLLIEAAAPLARAGALELVLYGDGPERERLRALARERGLEPERVLPGWVEHAHLPARLAECDVFAFPSFREFGGGALLEAMAIGLAPIAVDYGGPGELVTPECGWLLPLRTREQLVLALRAALEQACADPAEVDRRGAAARERALGLFAWDVKALQVLEVYRWVLGRRAHKPDFGMPLGAARA
jgi:glycosyltransferase involved in cell wall biosynthesis